MLLGSLMLPVERSLVSPAATYAQAYAQLLDAQLTCLVLDEQPRGRIVRMRSILEHLAGAVMHGLKVDPARPVATIAEHVETLPASAPIELAAQALWRRPSRALLVSDEQGDVVGILGWPQLNRFFAEILDVDYAARLHFEVADQPGAMAAALAAVAGTGANVQATYLSHPREATRLGTIYVPYESAAAATAALEAAGFHLVD